jgi:hypothetical protein
MFRRGLRIVPWLRHNQRHRPRQERSRRQVLISQGPQSSTSLLTVAQLRAVPATAAEVGPPERVHPKTDRHMVYVSASPATDKLDVIVGDPDELSEVKWASLADAVDLLPGMFEPVHAHLERELRS